MKYLHVILGVEDPMQHGRGVALADFNRDGKTDIVYGNWNGPHRLYMQLSNRKQRFKVRMCFVLSSNSTCSQNLNDYHLKVLLYQ